MDAHGRIGHEHFSVTKVESSFSGSHTITSVEVAKTKMYFLIDIHVFFKFEDLLQICM